MKGPDRNILGWWWLGSAAGGSKDAPQSLNMLVVTNLALELFKVRPSAPPPVCVCVCWEGGGRRRTVHDTHCGRSLDRTVPRQMGPAEVSAGQYKPTAVEKLADPLWCMFEVRTLSPHAHSLRAARSLLEYRRIEGRADDTLWARSDLVHATRSRHPRSWSCRLAASPARPARWAARCECTRRTRGSRSTRVSRACRAAQCGRALPLSCSN